MHSSLENVIKITLAKIEKKQNANVVLMLPFNSSLLLLSLSFLSPLNKYNIYLLYFFFYRIKFVYNIYKMYF